MLEGLDATGKSTQIEQFKKMQKADTFVNDLMLTHQPSAGGTAVGNAVYAVTEQGDIRSALARQYLHLASHAEQYERSVLPALNEGCPVIMDRCWWSTLAYGYFGGGLRDRVSYELFESIVRLPARGRAPDVVFLFMQPYQEDHHNTLPVKQGYEQLAAHYKVEQQVQWVPLGTPDQVTTWIMQRLAEMALVDPA